MKQTLAVMALLFSVFSVSQPAQGLSCPAGGSAEDDFRKAAAVFTGTVTEVHYPGTENFESKNYTSFQIQKIYKGDLPKLIVVETNSQWGVAFEVGKQYLVYLDGLDPYRIDVCKFGTHNLSLSLDRIKGMEDAGVKPHRPYIPRLTEGEPRYTPLDWVAGASLLVLGYILLKHFYPPHNSGK